MRGPLAERVLLVGWDAADWKLIHPLLDSGQMPALAGLVEQGVIGDLASLDPTYSPTVWTSIVTGKRPHKHGVLWFTEPTPTGDGIRPVRSTTRRCKALWNVLGQAGLASHSVGWWASHPAEPIDGVCVSNEFARASPVRPCLKPLPPGTVHPSSLLSTFDELRISPEELDPSILRFFVPRAAEIDQEKDDRLAVLGACLSECFTTHNAITSILENQQWRFASVFFDTIDHLSHGFMQYHPPKLAHVDARDFELFHHVVTSCYRLHDLLLARLLSLADDDTAVILVSDHGFHSDHLRSYGAPKAPAGPAACHRPYGIFAMKGPNVRRDERVEGVSVLDVTPTILGLLGLPVGADMDGRFVAEAFDPARAPAIETIPSWEDVEDPQGLGGMHPSDLQEDPYTATDLLGRMEALGYVEKSGEGRETAVVSVREAQRTLARDLLHADRPSEALPVLENLARRHPDEQRVLFSLAGCYLRLKRRDDAAEVLVRIEKATQNDGEPDADALLLRAAIHVASDEPRQAIDLLWRGAKVAHASRRARILVAIGEAHLSLREWPTARTAFEEAVEIDSDLARAHVGLTITALRMRLKQKALEHALRSVTLLPTHGATHFRLGMALVRTGELPAALRAFETSVALEPTRRIAARWIERLRRFGVQAPSADSHRHDERPPDDPRHD